MQYFGVIGKPIAHSLSPIIHNSLFSHFSLKAQYDKILLQESSDFPSLLLNLSGANVTLPYKEEVLRYCDELCGDAKEIQAVNTLYHKGGKWMGYNTDARGFYLSLGEHKIKRALILGAGGSAKAVSYVLQKEGIEVFMYNRTPEKISAFKGVKNYERGERYDLIINATSAGLKGELPLEPSHIQEIFSKAVFVFDLIYPSSDRIETLSDFLNFLHKREDTLLTSFAKKCKIPAIDGLDMLCYQAFLAFEIFCENAYNFEEIKQVFYGKGK